MVSHSVREETPSPVRNAFALAMASPNVKSQTPLHNFSLEDLKWPINHTPSHPRIRKQADKSPQGDTDSDSETQKRNPVADGAKAGNSGSSSDLKGQKSAKGARVSDPAVENLEKKPKLLIRFRAKNNKAGGDEAADGGDQMGDVEEFVPKTWNLRPRKPVTNAPNANGGGAPKINGSTMPENKPNTPGRSDLPRSKNGADAKVAEKKEKKEKKQKEKKEKEKPKLTIQLSKDEIEEDIFAITGSRPARRPRKRSKNVQRQLDG